MSPSYAAGSEEQFYGGTAYGSGFEPGVVPVNTATESGSANNISAGLVTKITLSSSITPSGQNYLFSVGLSSSVAPAGTVSILIGKLLSGQVTPKTNDTDTYDAGGVNVVDEYGITNQVINYVRHIDGLIKRTSHTKTSSISGSGSLLTNKVTSLSLTGSVSPASTVSNQKYTMYYLGHPGTQTPISAALTPSGTVSAVLQDPNDISYLAIKNSQKVVPRVKAYWANGRFTKNLFGLSSSDIYQDKTLDLNPVLYWKFDELSVLPGTAVTVALDSSLNDYDGQYVGTKTKVVGPLKGNDNGKHGLNLSGSGYVRLADKDGLNPVDNFQIECWIKIASAPASEQFVFSKGQGSANIDKQFALSVKSDATMNAYVYAGSSAYTAVSSTTMSAGEWYHVILTVDNQDLKIIVNGEVEDTTAIGADINVTSGPFEVGRLAGIGQNFVGDIDELAVYNAVPLSGSGGAYARYRSAINTGVSLWAEQFYPEQLMNGFSRVSYVWGVTDTKKLNGELITANGEVYAMEPENSYRYEHGWWSRSTSDPADGKMNFVETVVCEFDEHPCTQVDVFTSEFFAGIKEFDLYYKDTSNAWHLLSEGIVIDIDEFLETVPLGGLTQIKGLRVDIKSIWANDDVARIEELDPTYVTDISEDIVSFDISTDREDFDSNIPIGSANANGFSISLSNIALDYSLNNAAGPYSSLILPDVKFEVELGWYGAPTDENPSGFNYLPLGTFWADEWQESSDEMTVQVNARDYSKFLQETTAVGNVWLNIDGPDAIGNLLKESNYPAFDIVADLPYDTTCVRNSAAGLWMLHEQELNKYALSWNEQKIKQTAQGNIQHGPDGDFTLMFWVNTAGFGGERTLMHFYKSSTNYLHITNSTGGISVNIGGSKVSTGVSIADSEWHQVSLSWTSSTGTLKSYKDGVLKSTQTVGVGKTLDGTNYGLSFGAAQTAKNVIPDYSSYANSQFIGSLSYVLLWDSALSTSEIQDRAFRELSGLEADLLLAFTGYNGSVQQEINAEYIISKAYAQDFLRLVNVSFDQDGFMPFKDYANLSNALAFGSISFANDSGEFALEPYNKAVLLNGDKPTAIYFSGSTGSRVISPATYRLTMVNDIDIFIQLSLSTFTPASEQILYSQYSSIGNQRSLRVSLQTTGAIVVKYSTNGSSDTTVTSTVLLQNKDLRPNEKFWLRVSHDVDNGSSGNNVSVYISKENDSANNITSWELVNTITTAGALTSGRYSSNASVVLGSDAVGGNKFIGYIYAVYVTDGIDSADVRINLNEDHFISRNATSFTDAENNVWALNTARPSNDGGSYLYIPPNNALDILEQSFAIAMWIKPKANETYVLMSKDNIGNNSVGTLAILATADGRIGVVRKNGTPWSPSYWSYGAGALSNAGKINDNEWNFVVINYNHNVDNPSLRSLQIYANGEMVKNTIFSTGFDENNAGWVIGADSMLSSFAGQGIYLNGIAIFDKSLTQEQVTSLYRSGASLVNNRFPVVWTQEGETLWDAMLAVSTGDLGTFYFDYDNKFIYSNALNNYSPAYKEFAIPQWYFDDDQDIVSGSQTISLQANKIVVRLTSDGIDFNKRQGLWSAPDNAIISGAELNGDLTATFTEFLYYKNKVIQGDAGQPITIPSLLPSGYVKIDDEIIYYGRRDESRLYDLRRGQFDTDNEAHLSNARVREVRVFNIEYSSKPALVMEDPFITAVLYDKTVDVDLWRPDAFGAKLVISRNETGDPYLNQVLASTDPLNGIVNALLVSGIVFSNNTSKERDEYESAQYADNIRRYGLKQIEITNRFINSHYAAKKYADYFLLHFAEPVSVIDVAIMGNPMIKLGDRVSISSLDRMGITSEDYWVESNNIQYSGGIEQTLRLRKVM